MMRPLKLYLLVNAGLGLFLGGISPSLAANRKDVSAQKLAALVKRLKPVSLAAINVLGFIGSDARTAIPALKELSKDPDKEIREATFSLEKIQFLADS
jgi:hypothetical protein